MKYQAGRKLGQWVLQKQIGVGGNGTVWAAKKVGEDTSHALKLLKRRKGNALLRFSAEIEALKRAAAVDGLVPLIDYEIPCRAEQVARWYVMPLAVRMDTFLFRKSFDYVVESFVPLARTLVELHNLKIFHRDIKPANILGLNGRVCLSDFGLVKYPKKTDQTPKKASLGPKFTMAPEMRRDAKSADPGPADVYSFAKSLWIALTGKREGFDGQYSSLNSLALSRHHPAVFTTPLDDLLSRCTDNEPSHRPSMVDVEVTLRDWVDLQKNFHRRNLEEWVAFQNQLFPAGKPSTARWNDMESIVSVLQAVSRNQSLNHMFFPTGGGFDLSGVKLSSEAGCLELTGGGPWIIRPKFLSFESFGEGSSWTFLWIEADTLNPIKRDGAYVHKSGATEVVCEISAGDYVGIDAWDDNQYEGAELPRGSRPVTRVLEGSLVIFAKRSWYNLDSSTYDGRHYKMGYKRFRSYIASHAARQPEAPPEYGKRRLSPVRI